MGARNFSALETFIDFSNKGRLRELVYGNTFWVFDAFWVLVSKFMFYLLGWMIGSRFRVDSDKDSGSHQSETGVVVSEPENPTGYCVLGDSNPNGFNIKETDFRDQNENIDIVDEINGKENESSVVMETPLVPSSRKYEFLSNKGISGFIEEPKAISFIVHELYLGSGKTEESTIQETREESVVEEKPEHFSFKEKAEDAIGSFIVEQKLEKLEKEEDSVESFIIEKKPQKEDSCVDSFVIRHDSSVTEEMVVFEFMSCIDVTERPVHENCVAFGGENGENVQDSDRKILETKEGFISDLDDEFIELTPHLENPNVFDKKIRSIEGSSEDCIRKEILETGFSSEESDRLGLMDEQSQSSFEEEEEEEDSDDELEHDDVIELLKMEMKNARTGGLPTILEESESPQLLEELKPLKICEKFELKDRTAEIQKVYKNYSDRMRKLDVLYSQTTHSVSLLKLKDAAKSNTKNEKSFVQAPKSLRRHSLFPFKQKSSEVDPTERSIRDLHRDFETVYVGQICLSWEILHWQYTKTLEFQQHDVQGHFQYNLVAGDFQLFPVFLQRFVENEPFQKGPRVENYLKNRRTFHNFLQVPLVRDDRSRGHKCLNEGEYAITVDQLRDIIHESMHAFWEFLRADKLELNSILFKVPHQTQVSPQEPLDLELMSDIRTDLQRKEKRLKEILRSGTCMLKKFQKNEPKNNRLKDELFIAQVQLRLVLRVLNLSTLTTDQLIWCQEKLNKINFSGRKIHLDPSFSFFPC